MKTSKLLAVCGACAVTGVPAAVALAAESPDPSPLTAPHSPIVSALARHEAEHELLRLARRKARLGDRHVRRAYVRGVQAWSLARLRRERRDLRHDIRVLRRTRAVAVPGVLQSIAACESGGNPRAVGGGGAFRGKYQFDYGTWAGVGGSGDPAAAPEAEQDRRAALLYARAGASPWPVCGR
jgi:hypothetical protein